MIRDIFVHILSWESQRVIRAFSPKIIAITGSSGKSATRDALYVALASSSRVRKSGKTDDIFSPLCTILGVTHPGRNPFLWVHILIKGFSAVWSKKKYPHFLILEISASEPEAIRRLTKWLHPDITIVSSFADVPPHIEAFDSFESLVNEKMTLVSAVKDGGIVILNQDDGSVAHFGKGARVPIKTFGLVLAHISAKRYTIKTENNIPSGISFEVNFGKESAGVELGGCLGITNVYPILAALIAATHLGFSFSKICESFALYVPPKSRMRLLPGIKHTLIIDDTAGTNPASLSESLSAFKQIQKQGRKILVLGDMLYLGKWSAHAHTQAGKQAAFVDILITVGLRSRLIAEGALQAGLSESHIFQTESVEEAGTILQEILRSGDTVLVKGDKSQRLSVVVEEVMEYPERANEFLEK